MIYLNQINKDHKWVGGSIKEQMQVVTFANEAVQVTTCTGFFFFKKLQLVQNLNLYITYITRNMI